MKTPFRYDFVGSFLRPEKTKNRLRRISVKVKLQKKN